jgi:hypothetical protein
MSCLAEPEQSRDTRVVLVCPPAAQVQAERSPARHFPDRRPDSLAQPVLEGRQQNLIDAQGKARR